jgi:hypothetical protein
MKVIFTVLILLGFLTSCITYSLLEESKADVKFLKLDSSLSYNPNYKNYRWQLHLVIYLEV